MIGYKNFIGKYKLLNTWTNDREVKPDLLIRISDENKTHGKST